MSSPIRKSMLLVSAAAAMALAGCARPPITTGSINDPSDYRDRHPIVIDSKTKSLGIYPIRGPGGLDSRQRDDIRAFVSEYRTLGHGQIQILLPSSGGTLQRQTLKFIRDELKAAAITPAYTRLGHYEPINPSDVSPIKL
jgi:pilus assembly protein CpaD